MANTRIGAAVGMLLFLAGAALGQDRKAVPIPDPVTCGMCMVTASPVLSIGTSEGPGSLTGPGMVTADGRGRFWVILEGATPKVFGADGRFLTEIGRIGQGPGEFLAPTGGFRLPGDSMLILDRTGRATVVGPDLVVGRMIRLTASIWSDVIVVKWPEVVFANGRPSPRGVSFPLHRFSFSGSTTQPLGSFGADTGAIQPNPAAAIRRLTGAKAGNVWAADYGRFRLTLWTAAGEKVKVLERDPAWFPPSSDIFLGSPARPPESTTAGIREDPLTGFIWVFVNMPANTWREAWPAGRGREVTMRSIGWEKLYDTMVEVIDPTAARVVARGSIPGMTLAVFPDGRVAMYALEADDTPRFNILDVRLKRP
jgi:hypothetical protein